MPGDYRNVTKEGLLDLLTKETMRYNELILGNASKEEMRILRHELKEMLNELEKRRLAEKQNK